MPGRKSLSLTARCPRTDRYREYLPPSGICRRNRRSGDPAQSAGYLDAGRHRSRKSSGKGAKGGNLRGDGQLHPERASAAAALIYAVTPTSTTLASSRTPTPFAYERTSSTRLTAEAPGILAYSESRHSPYSSSFSFTASVMPSL